MFRDQPDWNHPVGGGGGFPIGNLKKTEAIIRTGNRGLGNFEMTEGLTSLKSMAYKGFVLI